MDPENLSEQSISTTVTCAKTDERVSSCVPRAWLSANCHRQIFLSCCLICAPFSGVVFSYIFFSCRDIDIERYDRHTSSPLFSSSEALLRQLRRHVQLKTLLSLRVSVIFLVRTALQGSMTVQSMLFYSCPEWQEICLGGTRDQL